MDLTGAAGQRFSQLFDVIVHYTFIAFKVVAPDVGENLVPAQNNTGVFVQVFQQLKLLKGEPHLVSRLIHLPAASDWQQW